MSNKLVFWTGILGVTIFVIASILGGFLFDNYNPISQFISETYSVDTQYGKALRFLGYIPSGIFLTIFCFSAVKWFPKSKLIKVGFWGLAIFYGMATIIVGLFPCDKGCNKEFVDPSISQIIHNLAGLFTYLFVPMSIIIIGVGLRKSMKYEGLSNTAFVCGLICILFFGLFLADPLTNYAGLFQRIIEGAFILWIIACAVFIKRSNYPHDKHT